jgi:hypothetical protein
VKGIIFNLVEEVVTNDHGPDAWDDILASAGVEGAYTAVGSYSDDELLAIVSAAAATTGLSEDDVMRHVGRHAIPQLAQRYPEFFSIHRGLRTFLPTLNSVIHPEVRKLYPGAQPPHFAITEDPEGGILMEYHSQRSMCHLAEGLVLGTADHYRQTVEVTQVRCTRDGAARCLLRITAS